MNGDYFIFMGTEGYLEGADIALAGIVQETDPEVLKVLQSVIDQYDSYISD